MTRLLTVFLIASLSLLAGCESFFGLNDEDIDSMPWGIDVDREPMGTGSFAVVGVSPSVAEAGDQVTIYTVSPEGTDVDVFENEDFWYCFFDGEGAMLETGGDDYDPDVPTSEVLDDPDIEISEEDLDGMIVSTTTVTVPSGSVSGEGLVFTPGGDGTFNLGID